MRQLTHNLAVKITAIFLFILLATAALASAVLTFAAYELKLYQLTWDAVFAMGEVWLMTLYDNRYTVIIVLVASVLLALLILVFLMCSAGHRRGFEEALCNGMDRIPLEIVAVVDFLIALLLTVFLRGAVLQSSSIPIILTFGTFAWMGLVLTVLSFLMTIATRYKTHTLWKNTIVHRILVFLHKLFFSFNAVWQGAMMAIGIMVLEIALLLWSDGDAGGIMLFIAIKVILLGAVVLLMAQMQKLDKAGEEISSGNLKYRVNTAHMYPALRRHGENLNNINQGISIAVEQRMKSERFKTELITNVSHDIKTPLTSIVNYVDLLKKEKLDNETAQSYIEVLDRQSARLKKLTEDLIEASKASTGNIAVHAEPTEVGTMLEQVIGEYDERFHLSQLEAVLNRPDEPVYIMADGRLLWRVLDNLMSNACKYAMPGTRLYLTLETAGDKVRILLKNISKYPLNISSEELMNRFVRGDESRSTEGSGLGLSIAQSLTQLQRGSMELTVDGDLFKVILQFPRLYRSRQMEAESVEKRIKPVTDKI